MTAVLGALLVVAGSTAIGFGVAAEKKNRLRCAEGFAKLFAHIETRLPSLALLEDIIADFESPELKKAGVLAVLKQQGVIPCNKRLLAAVETQGEDKVLYKVLLPVCRELGNTDYLRQQQSLKSARIQLEELCNTRRRTLADSERCYRWLGVLAGTAAVILLI